MMIVLKEKGVTKIIYMMRVRDTQKYNVLKKKFLSFTQISPKIGMWVWGCFIPEDHSRSASSSFIASSMSPRLFHLSFSNQ